MPELGHPRHEKGHFRTGIALMPDLGSFSAEMDKFKTEMSCCNLACTLQCLTLFAVFFFVADISAMSLQKIAK